MNDIKKVVKIVKRITVLHVINDLGIVFKIYWTFLE